MKMRHPKTKGVVAITEAQHDTFVALNWEQVDDTVPTDVELRDRVSLLGCSPSDDIDKLRAAHERIYGEPDAGVPDGSVGEVLEWVADDAARARRALEAEVDSTKPRKGLVADLEQLVAEAEEAADPELAALLAEEEEIEGRHGDGPATGEAPSDLTTGS